MSTQQNDSAYLSAFQLGWTLVEILGRRAHGMRFPKTTSGDTQTAGQTKNYYSRLSISTGRGKDNKTDQFRSAVYRWNALAWSLGLITKETTDEDPIKAPLEILKHTVAAQSGGQLPPLAELRALLQQWGLRAHARLAAQDVRLGLALVAGGSLADTYWYWLPPTDPPTQKKSRDKSWQQLLAHYRLFELRRRVLSLKDALPPYMSAVLHKHLRHWEIGQALFYTKRGTLRRKHKPWWWFRITAKSPPAIISQLAYPDEREIHATLGKQASQWADLVLGWKSPEQFLSYSDYCILDGIYVLTIAAGALVAAVALLGTMYAWAWITISLVGPALSDVLSSGNLKDRLLLLSTISGWFGTWYLMGKAIVKGIAHVANSIKEWLTAQIIARRTLVSWNRAYKQKRQR